MSEKSKKGKDNWWIRFWRRFIYEFAKWSGAIAIAPFLRLKKYYPHGKPRLSRKSPVMIVSNHLTRQDPIIVIGSFLTKKVNFLAAEEVLAHWGGGFVRAFGAIPIERDNPRLSTIKQIVTRFGAGDQICVFAEGRLPYPSETLEVRPFREGAAFIAAFAGVDIVPVFLAPRCSNWHRQRVVIGQRLRLADYITSTPVVMEEVTALTERMHKEVVALREYYYSLPKKRGTAEWDNQHAMRPPIFQDSQALSTPGADSVTVKQNPS